MRATLIVMLSSAILAFGCKQELGDRCVQNSDCASGICVGASVQGGHCASTSTVGTGSDAATATGGSSGQAGQGAGGEGGAAGSMSSGGPGGGPSDASAD